MGFREMSFTLEEGEFLGVSGPSGSGKSSLLKCIYRTYIPTSGTALYETARGEAVDIAAADDHTLLDLRKREISYVSQFLHVIPRVTAIDILAKTFVSNGSDMDDGKRHAAQLLSRLGLPESIWELFPSTFSGGEKQRLNIIRAIASRPRLLLLDEPTASLDAESANAVVSLIKDLKQEGTAMIGVFHDRELLDELSDTRLEISLRTAAGAAV